MRILDILAVLSIIAAVSLSVAMTAERTVNHHLTAASAALNQVNTDDPRDDLHSDR